MGKNKKNVGELERALDRYFEEFGENYPLVITIQQSDEEIIADIEKCLSDGKPKEDPGLDDFDY